MNDNTPILAYSIFAKTHNKIAFAIIDGAILRFCRFRNRHRKKMTVYTTYTHVYTIYISYIYVHHGDDGVAEASQEASRPCGVCRTRAPFLSFIINASVGETREKSQNNKKKNRHTPLRNTFYCYVAVIFNVSVVMTIIVGWFPVVFLGERACAYRTNHPCHLWVVCEIRRTWSIS